MDVGPAEELEEVLAEPDGEGRQLLWAGVEGEGVDGDGSRAEVEHELAELGGDAERVVEALQHSVLVGKRPPEREEVVVALRPRHQVILQHLAVHDLLHPLVYLYVPVAPR